MSSGSDGSYANNSDDHLSQFSDSTVTRKSNRTRGKRKKSPTPARRSRRPRTSRLVTRHSSSSEHEVRYSTESEPEAANSSGDATPRSDIELVLGHRIRDSGEHEFFVKFKHLSYHHLQWVLDHGERKFRNFLRKEEAGNLDPDYYSHDMYFNHDYLIPERILAEDENGHFLVLWSRLNYGQATWEDLSDNIPGLEELIPDFRDRQFAPKEPVKSNSSAMKSISKFSKFEESPQFKDSNTLRGYQLEGMNWLAYSWHQKRNTILADEMGLGKTMQAISLLWYLSSVQNIPGPFLVVVPLSTLENWKREIEKWTNLYTCVYHGSEDDLAVANDWDFYYFDQSKRVKWDVLLTTYQGAVSQQAVLKKILWEALVVDEAHRLKNKESLLFQSLSSLHLSHKLLLTGTPLQNNIGELWCMLHFLHPKLFPKIGDFEIEIGDLDTLEEVDKLHDILKPYLLRRIKEDVETLAPKEETIVEVELTTEQKKFYKAVFEQHLTVLAGAGVRDINNVAMKLRLVCNHPYTLDQGIEKSIGPIDVPEETMIKMSGKLMLLDKLLPKLKSEGHRVLLFSQFLGVLDIMEDFLRYRDFSYVRLDGSVTGTARQSSIDQFSASNSSIFVFLLSTRAGGVGINLTSADTVIIHDSDWNPQQDLQAQARCHRIGQNKDVKVYRLLTRGTYEARMFEIASLKLGLDQAVLKTRRGSVKPKKKEIEALLKYGAYHAFNDIDAPDMYDNDIDQILERNSKTVIHRGQEASSKFSKASFVSSAADANIDIEDPDFWKQFGVVEEAPVDYVRSMRHSKYRNRGDGHREDDGDLSSDTDSYEAEEPEESEDEEDDEDDDVYISGLTPKKKRKLKSVKPPLLDHNWGWNRKSRKAFIDTVLSYGVHNIAKIVANTGKTNSEVGLYIAGWVAMIYINSDDRSFTRRFDFLLDIWDDFICPYVRPGVPRYIARLFSYSSLRSLLSQIHLDLSLQDYVTSKSVVRLSGMWVSKCTHIHTLHLLITNHTGVIASDDTFSSKMDSIAVPSLPYDSWNTSDNRYLLFGLEKHGWGDFSLIDNDPELIFKEPLAPKNVQVMKRARILMTNVARPILSAALFNNPKYWTDQHAIPVAKAFVDFPIDPSNASEDDFSTLRRACFSKHFDHITDPAFKLLAGIVWMHVREFQFEWVGDSVIRPLAMVIRNRYPLLCKVKTLVTGTGEQLTAVSTNTSRDYVPRWWDVPRYDANLMLGTAKYGFGQWELMQSDRTLLAEAFRIHLSEPILKNETLISRLVLLTNLVENDIPSVFHHIDCIIHPLESAVQAVAISGNSQVDSIPPIESIERRVVE